MNIIIVLIYVLGSIVFLFALADVINNKFKNIFVGLHAQFFIVNVVSLIYCIFKIYQQFASQDIIRVITQFESVLFLVAAVNLSYVVKIIWDINNSKNVKSSANISVLIFLLFIEFFIIGSSWTAFYFYEKSKDIVLNQYGNYLYAMANSRASHISSLISDNKNRANLNLDLDTIDCLKEIESGSGMCTNDRLNKMLAGKISPVMGSTYLISALDKNGKVIGSTETSFVGEDWSTRKSFINHTKDGYFSNIFYDEIFYKYAIELSQPIKKDNEFLGVWVIRVRPDNIYNVLQDRTNLGDTGEAILVDDSGIVLSPQRFSEKMLVRIDNYNVSGCKDDFSNYVEETPTSLTVKKHDVVATEYVNEFGRDILGAHVVVEGPTKGLKWCVLVEIGKQEALGSFNKNLFEAALLSLIVIIVFTSIFIFTFDFFFRKLLKMKDV